MCTSGIIQGLLVQETLTPTLSMAIMAPTNECGTCTLEMSYRQHGSADQCCCCCEQPPTTEMEHCGDSGLSEAATECGDTSGKQHGSADPCCKHPTTPVLEICGDSGMSQAATEGGGDRAPVRRGVLRDKILERLHIEMNQETRLREVRRPRTQMKLQSPLRLKLQSPLH